jgi:small subunit ribosomal protein S4
MNYIFQNQNELHLNFEEIKILTSIASQISCNPSECPDLFCKESKNLSISSSGTFGRDPLSKVPTHLRLNAKNYKASVNQIVNRNSIGIKVNELLVVEYYSRQA